MLILHLLLLSVLLVIIFSISEYRNAKRAEKKSKKQHEATEVIFTKEEYAEIDDQVDLRMVQWSEMPSYKAN